MADANGSAPDFTHKPSTFTLEGHVFKRKKVRPREWAETLERVRVNEVAEIDKAQKNKGGLLFAVSGEGLFQLVRLAVHDDDLPVWDKLWEDGLIEFGELTSLRDWVWEQMTDRPFMSATPSSDGLGENSEASSKEESSSAAGKRAN